MSQLEKNLYKRVTVSQPAQVATSGRKYRGFSTVADAKSFSVYDFELIKQDLIKPNTTILVILCQFLEFKVNKFVKFMDF